ncbi:MAG: hypothetical protein RR523_00805 [Cetobacterium sp.]|uniref:hypothetical protein n=1 Tax=Cetobacterium sp. TaxID=2071632 RepID=UPI002FCA28BE
MRKVLLIEPSYKNKYPPIGLMKIATYYRGCGDDVRFFKGDMKDLAADLICEDLLKHLEIIEPNIFWKKYHPVLLKFIKLGKYKILEDINIFKDELILNAIKEYRQKYRQKDFFKNPRFDKVVITTLFTFYWKITIDTINFAKNLCKSQEDVMVGGIMSTLLPEEVKEATGITPHIGLLDKAGIIDKGDNRIIDQLPLDYSILDEIDYIYPANDAYFAYMTRGCTNRCSFCAVPILEPKYCNYISLKEQIEYTRENFGEQKNLLLMDNNVLASTSYDKIIDEIKECGFERGSKYIPSNEYEISIKNLKKGYNDRAYIKKTIKLYKKLSEKLKEKQAMEFYDKLEEKNCLNDYTASKEAILSLDEYVKPLYEKTFRKKAVKRIIDFNQGIEGKLVTDENMKKLAEVNIEPLRIAFDHWGLEKIYDRAIRFAVKNGIKNLSNYMLYNYQDKPEELYYRLKMTVNLCEELDANIYSFPMKYHPINDPEFFMNRDYIGKYWNRKFIRAIQAILNSTKGKIGRGKEFFEEAFGENVDEYMKLLWMPETFIIYRRKYNEDLRKKMKDKYVKQYVEESNLANEWWSDFSSLSPEQLEITKSIISSNNFKDYELEYDDLQIKKVINYYKITRNKD